MGILNGTGKFDELYSPQFIDWLNEYCFKLYRQNFSHITAENLSRTSLPKIENACFALRIYREIKPNKIAFNILLVTGIYIVGCVFAIVICIVFGGHALLASRSNPKYKTTGPAHGTGVHQSVCIHMIPIDLRLLKNYLNCTEKI